jgi:hypothetical protein
MSVHDLILDQRQNPDDVETYMEKKAELYPKNWFLPHTFSAMLGIHEQNKDSGPEQLRNMTGANDRNAGTFQKEISLVYSHYTAPLQEEINRLRHEKICLQQLQESGSELAQRGDMHRKALVIQNREQKKEITMLRNELKKRVEPKRQRTAYSKENAPTNSRVEQISVPHPIYWYYIVSKSGRQVNPSRRAMHS